MEGRGSGLSSLAQGSGSVSDVSTVDPPNEPPFNPTGVTHRLYSATWTQGPDGLGY